MSHDQIINELISCVGRPLTTRLLNEYKLVKTNQMTGKWSENISHGGKFAELSLAIIKAIHNESVDINKIKFNPIYEDFKKRKKPTDTDEILLCAIPDAVKALYTLRNKKNVAHVKEIDPQFIDSMLSSTICDWVLSQFVMITCKSDPKEIEAFIHSIIDRKISLIEEFDDGQVMILNPKMNFANRLLLTIYSKNIRWTREILKKNFKGTYRQKVHTTLANLNKKLWMHENENGIKITRLGIKEAESIIMKDAMDQKN